MIIIIVINNEKKQTVVNTELAGLWTGHWVLKWREHAQFSNWYGNFHSGWHAKLNKASFRLKS